MRAKEIAKWLSENGYSFRYVGDLEYEITGFASLHSCREGKLTWVKRSVNYKELNDKSCVTIAVVQSNNSIPIQNQFIADNSKELFFAILSHYWGQKPEEGYRGAGSFISLDAMIDSSVHIGANCSINGKVRIGAHTVIEDNVTIMDNVSIGEQCIIHSGTVIGKDGFGFAFDADNIPAKVPHFGGVVIGDRVEIGANCSVDRGTIDNTVIGDDVKIDSLTLIAHNVEIGKGTIIIGCTSLGGSSKIGSKSYIGPHVFIKNQNSVGSNSLIGMGCIVMKPLGDDMILPSNDIKPLPMKNYRKLL